jgi:hypothetical protein
MKAEQEARQQSLEVERDAIEQRLFLTRKGSKDEEDAFRELMAKEQEITDQTTADKIESEQYWVEKTKEGYEELGEAFADLIDTGLTAYFDMMERSLERQTEIAEQLSDDDLKTLEDKHKAGLMSTEEYEKEKAAKEAYYASVKEGLEREQFELEKQQKIAAIGMDLATGIVGIWAKYASLPPIAIGLTTLLTTIAGIQIASIAAEEYAEGGRIPMLGEGIIREPKNIRQRPSGDNVLAYVKRGETVLNDEQIERLGGAFAMREAGVPGYEDARYRPDMRDVGTMYMADDRPIEVTANFQSEDIVRKLDSVISAIGGRWRMIDQLKYNRYGKD